ncbi:hypothetical protein [Maioricimonas rarisocia]|uniref:hypothetical protein n=1 Tax=Maioricimonas rarisocia TaxID=2528026 RepID=UPI0011AA855D|nr:hypothetical protein [Maioricimonas rarisocia]
MSICRPVSGRLPALGLLAAVGLWSLLVGPAVPVVASDGEPVSAPAGDGTNSARRPVTGATSEAESATGTRPVDRVPRPARTNGAADDGVDVPPFYLSRVSLDGAVVENHVECRVIVEVQVIDGGVWHDVNLRMNQLHILSASYQGPGEHAPSRNEPRNDGLSWRFRGQGGHRLELTAWVPLKKSPAGEQLQLTLPPLPQLFEADCRIDVPGSRLIVKSLKNTTIRQHPLAEERTRIEARVADSRLDLTWQPQGETEPKLATAQSDLFVMRTNGTVRLLADLTVQPEGGQVSDLRVRMPEGFELKSVDGALYADHRLDPDAKGWVEVELTQATAETIQLSWTLEKEIGPARESMALSGFEVAGAQRQAGGIRILDSGSHRIVWREADSEFVARMNVVDGRLPGSPRGLSRPELMTPAGRSSRSVVNAFEILKQPFRLVLDWEPIQPSFTTASSYYLFLYSDRAELEIQVQIQVDAGVVDQFELLGTEGAAGDWLVEDVRGSIPCRLSTDTSTGNAPGGITIDVLEPTSRAFDVRLRMTQLLTDPSSEFLTELPLVQADHVAPSRLYVTADDNVEPHLAPAEGTVAEPPQPARRLPEGAPESFRDRSVKLVDAITAGFAFTTQLTHHPLTVSSTAVVEIRDAVPQPLGDALQIVQSTIFNVSYGRLTTLRFPMPADLRELIPVGAEQFGIEFQLEGAPLTTEFEDGQFTVTLPSGRSGRFAVDLLYDLPLGSNISHEARALNVPVIKTREASYESVRCEFGGRGTLEVRIDSPEWEPVRTARKTLWHTAEPGDSIPIVVSRAIDRIPQRFATEVVFVQADCDDDGDVRLIADYLVSDTPEQLLVNLPAAAAAVVFRWNDIVVEPEQWTTDAGTSQVLLELESRAGDSNRLEVEYTLAQASRPLLAGRYDLRLPDFGQNAQVGRTIWEVSLPMQHLLFLPPDGLTPQFTWQWEGMLFRRYPTETYHNFRQRLIAARGIPDARLAERGSTYAFSTYGDALELRLSSMNRSLTVLLGAGITMLLGFVFLRFERTRNIVTVLALALVFSLANLWFPEPMTVLMQPAALGLVLALAAAAIDNRLRMTRERVLDASSYPYERPSGNSSVIVSEQPGSTAVRSTVLRPRATSDSGLS